MKARYLIYGCLLAGLCLSLPGCDEDEKVTNITGITVTPANISPMEIGDELELTAAFTPADATEDIIWKSWNENIVKIEGTGAKVKLKAVSFGETRIFATSTSRIVVSPDINIKVNSDDYAGLMVGNYLGAGKSGMGDITDANIKLERVGLSNTSVKLTVVGVMASFGEQTITGESLDISLGNAAGLYNLNGKAKLTIPGLVTFDFTVTGQFNNADKSLTLKFVDPVTAGFPLEIDMTAVPGEPTDYGALAAGAYAGKADVESAMGPMSGLDMDVTLTRISSSKVDMLITSAMGNITLKEGQEIEVSAGTAANTCRLTGNAYMAAFGMDMTVTGTINLIEHTLTMELSGEFMSASITAELDIAKIVAGEYIGEGAMSGMMDMDLSGVEISMERKNKTTVNMFAVTALASIDCDLTVAPDGNFYSLRGATSIMGMDFTVTGTYNPLNHTVTLSINNPALQIELSAVKQYLL